ncbi:MAG: glycosyltransferase [Spirochaetales bacterium]|nr:glycosyltransferase [Spirochaetales bacterium]
MKASLIILCYKNLEYIDRVLKSCFIQDYPDIEIILRDDGSPNFSYENINAIFSYCPKRISYKIIHSEKNEGTVKNYNKAILASSGDRANACKNSF